MKFKSNMEPHTETRQHVPTAWKWYVATILPKLASFPKFLKPDVVHIYPNL